jgi:exonuclease SbcD
VAKSEHIRYCGSPIPLSFDELGTQKQVMLVEFTGSQRTSLTPISIPVFQPMQVLKGDLTAITAALQPFKHQDTSDLACWLCLEVDSQDYLSDLQQRIQDMTQGLNVEVLQLRRSRNDRRQLLSQIQTETLAELSPHDVFEKRLAMESFETNSETNSETEQEQITLQQVRQRFSQILSDVEHQGTEV